MRMRTTIGLSLALIALTMPALAKTTRSGHDPAQSNVTSKSASGNTASGDQRRSKDRAAARTGSHRTAAAPRPASQYPPPDQYIGPLRVIGAREVGYAAWYGGRHVGRRTASGERLDAIHATAAHRSLPLHSLVRVTNLRNGRSVVAKITDRGPVSRRLLIDVSPSAAEELDMMRSGIVSVAIEPVVAAENRPN